MPLFIAACAAPNANAAGYDLARIAYASCNRQILLICCSLVFHTIGLLDSIDYRHHLLRWIELNSSEFKRNKLENQLRAWRSASLLAARLLPLLAHAHSHCFLIILAPALICEFMNGTQHGEWSASEAQQEAPTGGFHGEPFTRPARKPSGH